MTPTTTKSARAVRLDEHVGGIVSSIGPRLKHLRQERHFSLQQLAARAEVSAAAIHKIERNDMVPTITTLLKIATALDRPVSYFVDSDEGPRDPVAFTPASHRPAVYTPHAGLSLAGVSGPYAPFRSAAAVATVEVGANSGDKPLDPSGRRAGLCSRRRADLRHRRHQLSTGAGRRIAFHRRSGSSLGERGQDASTGGLGSAPRLLTVHLVAALRCPPGPALRRSVASGDAPRRTAPREGTISRAHRIAPRSSDTGLVL